MQPRCTRFPERNVPQLNPLSGDVIQSFQTHPATAALLFLTKIIFKNNLKIIKRKCSRKYNTSTNIFGKRSHLFRIAIHSLPAQASTVLTSMTYCIGKVLLNTSPSRSNPPWYLAETMSTAEAESHTSHQHSWEHHYQYLGQMTPVTTDSGQSGPCPNHTGKLRTLL